MLLWKRWLLPILFGRWNACPPLETGYTILLPSPMDMPFLLRFALEGLRAIDTSSCRQILVVPDGWGDDGGAALRQVIRDWDDPRVELVELTQWNTRVIRAMRPPGCADTHWQLVVNGTRHARCEHCFLHDADAFFLESGGLEKQYAATKDRGMHALGVTPRWDPFFEKIGYQIPGTWELMYSTRWARFRSPYMLKGRRMYTRHGANNFDSMLYPMYLDYGTGTIGVMDDSPRLVHFSGTIFGYRVFRDRAGQPVVDELFRVLLLSMLENLLPSPDGRRVVPTVVELSRGLTDLRAPVRYDAEANLVNYGEFRGLIRQMCQSPIFAGERAERIDRMLEPFDQHFAALTERRGDRVGAPERRLRTHTIG